MTKILIMTLTPQLRKRAIKKRTSHRSSIPEYVNKIHTTTTQINNIHNSDKYLFEKITENFNMYEKNSNFKVKPSFVIIAKDTDIALPNVDKTARSQNKPQK